MQIQLEQVRVSNISYDFSSLLISSQDTAKSSHNARAKVNQIDLNRAGTGLLEIVTEPDMTSVDEAAEYVKTLQAVLRAIGASDGNMEAVRPLPTQL